MENKKANSNKRRALAIPVEEYFQEFSKVKRKINEAQIKAAAAANRDLALPYLDIGKLIAEKQKQSGWGTYFIKKLSRYLQKNFPSMGGFSRSNLFRMKAFFDVYSNCRPQEIESLPIFAIPWGHITTLSEKIKCEQERQWYAERAIENVWSRSTLLSYIESDFYRRQGKAVTNFLIQLPASHSNNAQKVFKDPYLFDFLKLDEEHTEQELEKGLIDHIQKFLSEMGHGFALMGKQVPLQIGDTEYYIDLLFYHFRLQSCIVIELKARQFESKDAGQIGLYVSAIDDLMKKPEDNATIGLILCKEKNPITVELVLRGSSVPIGVACYKTRIS